MKRSIIAALILCMGCELIVDVDVPRAPVKIVMNTIATADEPWTVELTDSKYILDEPDSFSPVRNATVVVEREDGYQLILEESVDGVYVSDEQPGAGTTYTITASAPDRETVKSVFTIPAVTQMFDVKWDSADIKDKHPGSNVKQYQVPLTITFKDKPGEENFYSVEIVFNRLARYQDRDGNLHEQEVEQNCIIDVTDPALKKESAYGFRFNDKTFDGKTYTLPMLVTLFEFDPPATQYEVVLYTMSKDLFQYFDQREVQDEVDGDPFAQPVQVTTNVKNGFGLIGAISSDRKLYKR